MIGRDALLLAVLTVTGIVILLFALVFGYLHILMLVVIVVGATGFGSFWGKPGGNSELTKRIDRVLIGLYGGVFLLMAADAGTEQWHSTCEGSVDRESGDCFGKEVAAPGPNYGGVLLFLVIAGYLFYRSVKKSET